MYVYMYVWYVNNVGVYWKIKPCGFDFIKYKSNKYS